MIQLRPYQQETIQKTRDAFAGGSRRVLLQAATGAGKCLARGTPVLMWDGTVRCVEDVRVGDYLMGPDSRPRRVVSLARGREEMFRVTPTKGEPFTVNRSHILSVKMTRRRCADARAGSIVNLSVSDYLTRSSYFRHCAKGWRAGVDFPANARPLPFPAYFLGLWLGDGSSRGPSVTTGDPEVLDYLRSLGSRCGLSLRIEENSENSVVAHLTTGAPGPGRGHRSNALRLALYRERLLQNKHIPHLFKTAKRADRLDLLAGVLDSHGYWSGRGFSVTLKNERLLEDVIFVARSLGFAAYKSRTEKTCHNTGARGVYWTCHINGPVDGIPCRVPRKKATPRKQKKDPLVFGMTVVSVGKGDYFGFEIEGPDRLFLLGDFTVTHNTVMFSHVTHGAQTKGRRVSVFAHREEIIDQISRALRLQGVRHGWITPGRSMTDDLVHVGMIQTASRRVDRMPPPDLIVIDEAHHAVSATYQRVLDAYPAAKVLGVSATPARVDGRGLGDVFDAMVQAPSMRELIEIGALARYRYLAPPADVDLSAVAVKRGDYVVGDLEKAMDKATITGDVVRHYLTHLRGDPTVVFCTSVAHAEHVSEQFRAAGISSCSVDGRLEKSERKRRLGALADGSARVVTSCDLISEGVDVPGIVGCILLRPTQSVAVFLQQVGRALRPKPDGSHAVILDHVGNVGRHGLPDAHREWSLDGRKKLAQRQVKTAECDRCYTVFEVVPGWKSQIACPDPGPRCILQDDGEAASRRDVTQIDGDLVEIGDSPEWASGESLASGDLRTLMSRASGLRELSEIERARGFKHGWAHHVYKSRRARKSANA